MAFKTYVAKDAFVLGMGFSIFCSHAIKKNLVFLVLFIKIKITQISDFKLFIFFTVKLFH